MRIQHVRGKSFTTNLSDEKYVVLGDYIKRKIEGIALYDNLLNTVGKPLDEESLRYFVYAIIPNELSAYINKIAETLYMGGFGRWPVV